MLRKETIGKARTEFNDFEKAEVGGLSWFQRSYPGSYIAKMTQEIEKTIPSKYREELKGMAEGSGQKYEDLVFIAGGAGLLQEGCTSVLTKLDDRLIHGRNFDFEPHCLANYPIIVEYNLRARKNTQASGLWGGAGVFQGVNKAGISVTTNDGGTFDAHRTGMPIAYKIREILENSTTLQDVDSILTPENGKRGCILTVGSVTERTGVVYYLTRWWLAVIWVRIKRNMYSTISSPNSVIAIRPIAKNIPPSGKAWTMTLEYMSPSISLQKRASKV